MNIDRQLKTDHLLLEERTCRICGENKNLLSDFHLSRSNNPDLPSSYSYECKECSRIRVAKIYSNKDALGTCSICEKGDLKLVNDICRNCNRALKSFEYNIKTLEKALIYLKKV